MLIDGITWACETCIRGHRAANCQHIERPLQPLGRKGRPVSQCHHCRSLRHSRSLHTRCKCELMARNGASEANGKRCKCRCMEGEACTCAYKKGQTTTSKVSGPQSNLVGTDVLLQSPGSSQGDSTMVQTPLQSRSCSDSSTPREPGHCGVGSIEHTEALNGLNGWDPTLATKSPTMPSTAIAVEGTEWESPSGAYPDIQPPYAGFMQEDQLSLELSALMDAFVENSAMGQFENNFQDNEPSRLDPNIP
ncbi:hypothetical protein TWF718_001995 [Orbilia javanica]|uniref:Copper-fist domain-containing protein n=1 Tax=Orbilia javanica TaxID=47235 RepID=A0AAN8RNR6_9PEZI